MPLGAGNDPTKYVGWIDYLAIAEVVAGIDAKVIQFNHTVQRLVVPALNAPRTYNVSEPVVVDLPSKAAVLEWHLIRARPLPVRNVAVAHEVMLEFLRKNGYELDPHRDPSVDVSALLAAVRAGDLASLATLTAWIQACAWPKTPSPARRDS